MIIDNVRKANMHEQKLKIAVGGKGGVGKTTVAGTLARLIAKEGRRVIAVDADPAMNLRFALGIKTTKEFLVNVLFFPLDFGFLTALFNDYLYRATTNTQSSGYFPNAHSFLV